MNANCCCLAARASHAVNNLSPCLLPLLESMLAMPARLGAKDRFDNAVMISEAVSNTNDVMVGYNRLL